MRILPVLVLMTVPVLAAPGCARQEPAATVPSVAMLESDPILLSRVLGNCNEHPEDVNTAECINARAAVDRRSVGDQAAREKRAEAGFEMAREARRRAEEAAQQSRDALQKRISPYELPVEGADEKPAPSEP